MANLRNCFTLLILILATSSCGLSLAQKNLAKGQREETLTSGSLVGKVHSVDGRTLDLADEPDRIQVVMFVSETCSVCRHETANLVQDRAQNGIPSNATFFSIVVGSVLADAADWKNELGVDWAVAVDVEDKLFRSYCPELQTPCVLLRDPIQNRTTKLVGEHSLEEWQNFTGKWRLP